MMGHNSAVLIKPRKPTPAQIDYAIWIAKQHFGKRCLIHGEACLLRSALIGSHIRPRGLESRLAANPHNIIPLCVSEDQAFEKVSPGKRIRYIIERVAGLNRSDLNRLTQWIELLRSDAVALKIAVEY